MRRSLCRLLVVLAMLSVGVQSSLAFPEWSSNQGAQWQAERVLLVNGYYELNEDLMVSGLIVTPTGVLNTRGFEVHVLNTLMNEGVITDSHSGAAGGAGGAAGDGGACPHQPPETCLAGQDGQPGNGATGAGGAGGGGGGGGGGAWNVCLGCLIEGCVKGGDGGNGGEGGRGGGHVIIYTRLLDNQGVIHADGAAGESGRNGNDGDFNDYFCNLVSRDAAGGGGGGGGGGNGGDGGTVEIHCGCILEYGEIRADGGAGGLGGLPGMSQCDLLIRNAGICQRWEYGGGGCTPGLGGTGWGGQGGASDIGVLCDPNSAGPGANGSTGQDGTVKIWRVCRPPSQP